VRSDKVAARIVGIVIIIAMFLIIWAFIFPGVVWGVPKPVHAQYGWNLDSLCWYLYVDSVKTDSSGKLYDVTGWPDTSFDLALGHYYEIRFYAWNYGYDSSNWSWKYDLYDYNNANCVGGGDYVTQFLVLDTATDPDSGVYRAKITVTHDSSTGSTKTFGWTDNNGFLEVALDNGDFSAFASGVTFSFVSSPIDFTVASGPHYDTIEGYRIPTPSPPSPDYATLEGYVYTPSGEKMHGLLVKAIKVKGSNTTDTTSTPLIIPGVPTYATVDTSGYFSMTLQRTGTFDDTTRGFYNISGHYGESGEPLFNVPEVYIPATGNVNLGQIMARRGN